MKKTAVVILNWNGRKLLEQLLPSVIRYTSLSDTEIVVADNGSDDDSIEFLQKNYQQIRVVSLSENLGFAEGYNKALAKVDAEYYVLLNSDVEVTNNWLTPIINYLDNHPNVAAAQPKILAQRNKEYFEYAGAAGGFLDKYGYPFCRGRIFKNIEKDDNQYDSPIDVLWATGACLVIRSKDFFDTGGFDASFFAHMEEIDLCWRLNSRGRKVMCLPETHVYHVGAATLSVESPRKTYLNFRNNLLMLYKNLPQKNLKRTMIIRLVLDYVAAIQFALTGKYNNAKMIIKAHDDFYKNRGKYRNLRSENLKKTVNFSIKTIYTKSILVDYYLKRNTTFAELEEFNRFVNTK